MELSHRQNIFCHVSPVRLLCLGRTAEASLSQIDGIPGV